MRNALTATAHRLVYDDDLLYAYHPEDDDGPSYLGSLLIVTKRHAPTLADLTDAEARAIGLLVARLGRALKACVDAERIYTHCFAETVPHVHMYVIARYSHTPKEFLRWRVFDWPDAPRGETSAVAALCAQLRECLAEADNGIDTLVP